MLGQRDGGSRESMNQGVLTGRKDRLFNLKAHQRLTSSSKAAPRKVPQTVQGVRCSHAGTSGRRPHSDQRTRALHDADNYYFHGFKRVRCQQVHKTLPDAAESWR